MHVDVNVLPAIHEIESDAINAFQLSCIVLCIVHYLYIQFFLSTVEIGM